MSYLYNYNCIIVGQAGADTSALDSGIAEATEGAVSRIVSVPLDARQDIHECMLVSSSHGQCAVCHLHVVFSSTSAGLV